MKKSLKYSLTGPAQITAEDVAILERFTILLYDCTSDLTSIDEARKHLFRMLFLLLEQP